MRHINKKVWDSCGNSLYDNCRNSIEYKLRVCSNVDMSDNIRFLMSERLIRSIHQTCYDPIWDFARIYFNNIIQ